jgi:hypothetical protein
MILWSTNFLLNCHYGDILKNLSVIQCVESGNYFAGIFRQMTNLLGPW